MSVVTVSDKQEQESRLIILTKKHIDFSKKNHFPAAAFKLKESNWFETKLLTSNILIPPSKTKS